MKKKAIIILSDQEDSFQVNDSEMDVLTIPTIIEEKKTKCLNHNINRLLMINFLPSEQVIDFLNLSIAVYSADQLISRESYGYLGWNRLIKIYLPVLDLHSWQRIQVDLEEMLSFLSGDKWFIDFRERKPYNLMSKKPRIQVDQVALFSGGLDSYAGAINFLSDKKKVAFVGHHKSGPNELSHQKALIQSLGKSFSASNIEPFFFHVQPEKDIDKGYTGETSQRARSILFIALGLAVANSFGQQIKLAVPENGLISLNIPLTKSRIGSLSTRTTHPYFFHLLNKCLEGVGISNKVLNPYNFFTKGEILENCGNQSLLSETAKNTVSCSKPGHYIRWFKGKNVHCGHCVPCIIRRAAMNKVGLDSGKEYEFDVKKAPPSMGSSRGFDYNAFKSSLERIKGKEIRLIDIAQSGPLPGDVDELNNLKQVYLRGMNEVKTIIHG